MHICKKLLRVYSYNAIERIQSRNRNIVVDMFKKYSLGEYFEPYFKRLCYKYGVRRNDYLYQECYDAGMLAYVYSIYRCSIMKDKDNSQHVKAYIWKIVKIYFVAAMVISNDSENLCKENGFRQVNCTEDHRV